MFFENYFLKIRSGATVTDVIWRSFLEFEIFE